METYYDSTVGWSESEHAGITLDRNHKHCTLETIVPNFVTKELHELQHPAAAKPQHDPAKAVTINYEAKTQEPVPKKLRHNYVTRRSKESKTW